MSVVVNMAVSPNLRPASADVLQSSSMCLQIDVYVHFIGSEVRNDLCQILFLLMSDLRECEQDQQHHGNRGLNTSHAHAPTT